MITGEVCVSVLGPDQNLLLCPPSADEKTAADELGTSSSSGKSSLGSGGGGDNNKSNSLSAYLHLATSSSSSSPSLFAASAFSSSPNSPSTTISASSVFDSHSMTAKTGNVAGRRVYIQLTNFRLILKFFGEEQTNNAISLPYSAIQTATVETASGAQLSLCGALFPPGGSSGSGSSSSGGGNSGGSGGGNNNFSTGAESQGRLMNRLFSSPPQQYDGPSKSRTNTPPALSRKPNQQKPSSSTIPVPTFLSVPPNPDVTVHLTPQLSPTNANVTCEDLSGRTTPTVSVPTFAAAAAAENNETPTTPIPKKEQQTGCEDDEEDGSKSNLASTLAPSSAGHSSSVLSDKEEQPSNNSSNNNNKKKKMNQVVADSLPRETHLDASEDLLKHEERQKTNNTNDEFEVVSDPILEAKQTHKNPAALAENLLHGGLLSTTNVEQHNNHHNNHNTQLTIDTTAAAAASNNNSYNPASPAAVSAIAPSFTKHPIIALHIETLHGWSWRLLDPATALMSEHPTPAQVEARGLNKLANELLHIMNSIKHAGELFATASSLAAAASSSCSPSSSSSSSAASACTSPTATAATTAETQLQLLEDKQGFHIYNAKRDLARMLSAAAHRGVMASVRNLSLLSPKTAAASKKQKKEGEVEKKKKKKKIKKEKQEGKEDDEKEGEEAQKDEEEEEEEEEEEVQPSLPQDGITASAQIASLYDTHFLVQRLDHGSSRFATYPLEVLVPSAVDQTLLLEASHCRQNGRVPVISWICPHRKVTLSRSSQPLVTGQWNADADVKLLQAIRCSFQNKSVQNQQQQQSPPEPPPPQLIVADCRSRQAAVANMAVGGGYETSSRYGKDVDIIFLDLPNVHDIVKAFEKLRGDCAETQRVALTGDHPLRFAANQASLPQDDSWLRRRRALIRAAAKVAYLLDSGKHVLTRCTDGWDRTPQIICLTKILIDSYFRTVRGFCELVEREWLQFGHRFADRCCGPSPSSSAAAAGGNLGGASSSSAESPTTSPQTFSNTSRSHHHHHHHHHSSEQQQQQQQQQLLPDWCRYLDATGDVKKHVAPIFLQFLDAVRELVEMFPNRFEFTASLLSSMLHASYSTEFGTFLCNTMRQRVHPVAGISHRTCSFWTEVTKAVEEEVIGTSHLQSLIQKQQQQQQQQQQNQQQQQQQQQLASRLFDSPGIADGVPLVNPLHRNSLRISLGFADPPLPASSSSSPALLLSSSSSIGFVDDGSVLVPIFEAGSAQPTWHSWFSLASRWGRFSNFTFSKRYVLNTGPTATADGLVIAGSDFSAAASSSSSTVTSSTSGMSKEQQKQQDREQKLFNTTTSTQRMFTDAIGNSDRHKQLFIDTCCDPSASSSSSTSASALVGGMKETSSALVGGLTTSAASSSSSGGGGGLQQRPRPAQESYFSQNNNNFDSSSPPPLATQFGRDELQNTNNNNENNLAGEQSSGFYETPVVEWLQLRDREDAPACGICRKTFSFFNRRHTCRACCRSCCGDCCARFAVIFVGLIRDREARQEVEKNANTAVRLCNECFFEFQESS